MRTEAALRVLNERRQALSFRIALALLDRASAQDSARRLAWLADAVVACVVQLAWRRCARAWPSSRRAFAVLGYGSLGGEELGFGSDLDLVFLYDARRGANPMARDRWMPRAGSRGSAQKIVALAGDAAPVPAACSSRRAPAPGWREGPAGVERWPASPTTSASAHGRGNTRRWCARVRRRRCR
jgi:hypothetical protein